MKVFLVPSSVVALFIISGCTGSEKFDQTYHENFFASIIARSLELSERIDGKDLQLTNLLLLTNSVRIDVLADYEEKFLRYGSNAGFTNSLLDRYVILPKGVKGPPPDEGEIILVGGKPLEKKNGQMKRIFVAKYPKLSNSFGADWIEEERFQQALRATGIRLADLPPGSAVPSMRHLYDPKGEIAASRREMAKDLDAFVAEYERQHPTPIWQRRNWQIAGFLMAVLLVLAASWYVGRRRRH